MRGLHPGPLVPGAKATCSPSPCRARRWDSGVPSKALVGEGEGRGPRGEPQPLLQAPAFHFPRPERSASRRGGRGHAGRAVADCVGEAFAGPPGRSGRSPLRPGTEKACGRPSRPCPHAACRPWRGSKSPFPHEDNRSGLRARPIPGFSSVTPVETGLQTAWGLGVLGGGVSFLHGGSGKAWSRRCPGGHRGDGQGSEPRRPGVECPGREHRAAKALSFGAEHIFAPRGACLRRRAPAEGVRGFCETRVVTLSPSTATPEARGGEVGLDTIETATSPC